MRALEGKCALITGSTQGLGLAAAHRFAAAGCHVVLSGLASPDEAAALGAELASRHGVRAVHAAGDLSRPVDIDGIVETARSACGGVDILVNNAVVRHAAPVEAFSAEKWDEGLAVNLSAAFHLIRLTMPAMQARGGAASSTCRRSTVSRARPTGSPTSPPSRRCSASPAPSRSKGSPTASRATPSVPAPPKRRSTRRQSALRWPAESLSREEAERRFFAAKQPTGRFISADQVAALMVFLCGPDAGDITGAAVPVDGAWSAS